MDLPTSHLASPLTPVVHSPHLDSCSHQPCLWAPVESQQATIQFSPHSIQKAEKSQMIRSLKGQFDYKHIPLEMESKDTGYFINSVINIVIT